MHCPFDGCPGASGVPGTCHAVLDTPGASAEYLIAPSLPLEGIFLKTHYVLSAQAVVRLRARLIPFSRRCKKALASYWMRCGGLRDDVK